MASALEKLRRTSNPPPEIVEMADRGARRNAIRAEIEKLSDEDLYAACDKAGVPVHRDASREMRIVALTAFRMDEKPTTAEEEQPSDGDGAAEAYERITGEPMPESEMVVTEEKLGPPIEEDFLDDDGEVPNENADDLIADEEMPAGYPANQEDDGEVGEAEAEAAGQIVESDEDLARRVINQEAAMAFDAWHDEQVEAGSKDPLKDEAKRRWGTTNKVEDADLRAEILARGGEEPSEACTRANLVRRVGDLRRAAAQGELMNEFRAAAAEKHGFDVPAEPEQLEEAEPEPEEPEEEPIATDPAAEWWDDLEIPVRENLVADKEGDADRVVPSKLYADQAREAQVWIEHRYDDARAPTAAQPADARELIDRAKELVRDRDIAIDEWEVAKEEARAAKKRVDRLADELAALVRNVDPKQLGLFA